MNRSRDQTVALEFPQLLSEHLLGDLGNCAFEFREAHHRSGVEVEKDAQLPAAINRPKRIFGSARSIIRWGNRIAARKGPYFFVRTCHGETIIAKRSIVEGCVLSIGSKSGLFNARNWRRLQIGDNIPKIDEPTM